MTSYDDVLERRVLAPRQRSRRLRAADQVRRHRHLSTACYVALYLLLRAALPPLAASAVSLLVTALANTAANRRLTFGIRGRAHAASAAHPGNVEHLDCYDRLNAPR